MGVLRSIIITKPNIEDRGLACMFLGYVKNYMGGTYHVLSPGTKHIILSNDVICMNKTFGGCLSIL